MSETSPQSGFDLSSLFGLSGLGDIGAGFGLLRRAFKGEQIDPEEIPAGLQRKALEMAMTQVGVNPAGDSAIEMFLKNETIIAQVREVIEEDLAANIDTPQDTILFKAINDMSGAELQAMLVTNPDVMSMITESQDFQDMLQEQVSGATIGQALSASDVPIEGLSADFLSKNMSELSVDDLTNLSTSELDILVPALPQDVFNTNFVERINGTLGEEHRIEAPTEDSYAARQEAYEAAKGNLIEHGPGGFLEGLAFAFSSATGMGIDMESEFYSAISESMNADTITQMQTLAQTQAHAQIENFNFADMAPEDIRTFFDQNKDMIAAQLTDQENWPKIEEAINADLLIRNQRLIMDNMLPEMTGQGLSALQDGLENLPPQIRQLLTSFIDFAADMLGKFGIDIDGFAADPSIESNAGDSARQPDEVEQTVTTTPGLTQ